MSWPVLLLGELACDHAHGSLAVRQADGGNIAIQDGLIMRRRHLVFRGQIHPKLHHLEHAAAPRELAAMKLFMHDAGSRGHPLHIARADRPPPPEESLCSTSPS